MSERVLVRIYDDHSDAPQPIGPIGLDVPDGATDAEIAQEVKRQWASPTRPASVEWNGGSINRGWAVRYED